MAFTDDCTSDGALAINSLVLFAIVATLLRKYTHPAVVTRPSFFFFPVYVERIDHFAHLAQTSTPLYIRRAMYSAALLRYVPLCCRVIPCIFAFNVLPTPGSSNAARKFRGWRTGT